MIRDRGNKKWVSLMLPEHVKMLKDMTVDLKRQKKPVLDDYQIQEFEERIHYAKEYKLPVEFVLYDNGFTESIIGRIHSFDQLKNQIKIIMDDNTYEYIHFPEIINVKLID